MKLPFRRRSITASRWTAASGTLSTTPTSTARKSRGKAAKNTLALCGKTNVLTYVYDLWERAFHEMGQKEFPEIAREYYHVDATCMWIVKNPEWFDVVVTGNMFGDIITDLGAMTQGGMGIAAGGNINPEGVSMFEPIGGSAPKYTGQGVINPLAAICAMQMMLETLGEEKAAAAVEEAVMFVTANKLKTLAGRQDGLFDQPGRRPDSRNYRVTTLGMTVTGVTLRPAQAY